jgi:DNA-binding transcriptional ArsR family regulator
MEYEADLPAVAGLIANRARAAMLDLLLDGEAHPANDLAREAHVAPSTASGHLASLVDNGLIDVDVVGRQRRYRLSGPEVARALEALAALAPRRPVSSLAQANAGEHLRFGRTCYDHLAGRLGVSLTDALVAGRALRFRNSAFALTRSGEAFLESIGMDVALAREQKRGFALACQDWTERRSHLAGALGAAFCERLFDMGWIRRRPGGRAVAVTAEGAKELRTLLGVDLGS